MLNKEYFFKGKGFIRKIKDKAFFDFVIAHKDAGDAIQYIPTKVYIGDSDRKFVTCVRVTGGAITMDYELSSSGHWLSEEDWNALFEVTGKLLELHDKVVKLAGALAVANYQFSECAYSNTEQQFKKLESINREFREASEEFKSQLRK